MILAIETSSVCGSVALADPEKDQAIWCTEFRTGRGHGGALFRALEEALHYGSGRLEEIIVGLGPGSYSGVRLAVSAAAGLALATGARLGGRPSPLALATDAPEFHALGDARRGMFYYTAVRHGRPVFGPALLDSAGVGARLGADPGWPVFTDTAGLLDGSPEIVAPAALVCLPDAARFVTRRLAPGEIAPAGTAPAPIYLRAPTITLPKARGDGKSATSAKPR